MFTVTITKKDILAASIPAEAAIILAVDILVGAASIPAAERRLFE